MNFLFDDAMRRFSIIVAAVMLAGCAGSSESSETLRQREEILLSEGLIYYGHDQEEDAFDDMYYAFVAGEDEMADASAKALKEFRSKLKGMSSKDRAFLGGIFSDYADLAEMADYAYKDSKVTLPKGWKDLGAEDETLEEIIDRYSVSGFLPSGLKCSLMAKGNRRLLVFAGTDFPSSWTNVNQVMHFIIDAYEDVNGALNADASQVVLAAELVDELLKKGYVTKDNLEFAGHSLGGRLASEMAVRYECPAVLFNAAGVSPDVYEKYEDSRNSARGGWRGYIVDVIAANDPLTCAQKYMSGSADPFVSTAAKALSMDSKTVDGILSLGLSALGTVVDKVSGGSEVMSAVKGFVDKYGDVVDEYYERDYRALGAMMPIREDMGGHGIKELAAALRSRAELCGSI